MRRAPSLRLRAFMMVGAWKSPEETAMRWRARVPARAGVVAGQGERESGGPVVHAGRAVREVVGGVGPGDGAGRVRELGHRTDVAVRAGGVACPRECHGPGTGGYRVRE